MKRWRNANEVRKTARRKGKCACGKPKEPNVRCSECENRWRREKRRKDGPLKNGTGICPKCYGPRETGKHCQTCRKEYLKVHYDRNPEQYAARNRRWKRANPEALAAMKHARRSREQQAEGRFTPRDITAIRTAQRGKCANCGVKAKLTIDHIIPLSRGGSNWPINLQLLCMPCNARKWAHIPENATPTLFEPATREGSNECLLTSADTIRTPQY